MSKQIVNKKSCSDTLKSKKASKSKSKGLSSTPHLKRDLLVFGLLVLLSVSLIYLFFKSAPLPPKDVCDEVSLRYMINGVLPPWIGGRGNTIETVKSIWKCATAYKQDHPGFALASFCLVYISLQTFAIPGPIVLSILSGALYPFAWAQVLVSFCATLGASLCYLLSYVLGRVVIQRCLPSMLQTFQEKISENRQNLLYYLLFLRITPLLPNWFVNIACPLVDVEFKYFFIATFIGLLPANFLHISTGATLNNAASSNNGSSNVFNFVILFLLQFVALLPTIFKKKIEQLESKKFN